MYERWIAFLQWFRDSETVFFARMQLLAGAIWLVLITTDLSPLFSNPKIMAGWLVFSGVVTETARRAREDREKIGDTEK